MGAYEGPNTTHQDQYGQYGQYVDTEDENSEAEEAQHNLFDGVTDGFRMEHGGSFSTPGQSAR